MPPVRAGEPRSARCSLPAAGNGRLSSCLPFPLRKCVLISFWRHAMIFLEYTAKIFRILKSAFQGNFVYSELLRCKQLFGPLHTDRRHMLGEGLSRPALDQRTEIGGVKMEMLGCPFQCKVLFVCPCIQPRHSAMTTSLLSCLDKARARCASRSAWLSLVINSW